MICCVHVNLLSRFMPRYLPKSLLRIVKLLVVTYGQVCFRSVKVTCVDLFSLICEIYFFNFVSLCQNHIECNESVIGKRRVKPKGTD